MSFSKKIAAVARECVACGCCVKICPMKAITIYKGIHAVVNIDLCVGCGKCAVMCPAGVIEIVSKEREAHEKTLV